MAVSEASRVRRKTLTDRDTLEVIISPTDTVIGEDADTGEIKRIDLSVLNPETPVAKALARRQVKMGEVIPIARGDKLLWRFVFTELESETP